MVIGSHPGQILSHQNQLFARTAASAAPVNPIDANTRDRQTEQDNPARVAANQKADAAKQLNSQANYVSEAAFVDTQALINNPINLLNSTAEPRAAGNVQAADKNPINASDDTDEISDDADLSSGEDSPARLSTMNLADAESKLTEAELRQLQELRARDREVRAHEQAHVAAAGSLARGGPSFQFQRGPDGRSYAVGGEVQIDTSAVSGNPQGTAAKAQQIQRAATAPAQPSAQDRAVAANAAAMEVRARAEITQQARESRQQSSVDRTADSTDQGIDTETSIEQGTELASEKALETHTKCAVCGGQHSGESHTTAVEISDAFRMADNAQVFARAGSLFSISV